MAGLRSHGNSHAVAGSLGIYGCNGGVGCKIRFVSHSLEARLGARVGNGAHPADFVTFGKRRRHEGLRILAARNRHLRQVVGVGELPGCRHALGIGSQANGKRCQQ